MRFISGSLVGCLSFGGLKLVVEDWGVRKDVLVILCGKMCEGVFLLDGVRAG